MGGGERMASRTRGTACVFAVLRYESCKPAAARSGWISASARQPAAQIGPQVQFASKQHARRATRGDRAGYVTGLRHRRSLGDHVVADAAHVHHLGAVLAGLGGGLQRLCGGSEGVGMRARSRDGQGRRARPARQRSRLGLMVRPHSARGSRAHGRRGKRPLHTRAPVRRAGRRPAGVGGIHAASLLQISAAALYLVTTSDCGRGRERRFGARWDAARQARRRASGPPTRAIAGAPRPRAPAHVAEVQLCLVRHGGAGSAGRAASCAVERRWEGWGEARGKGGAYPTRAGRGGSGLAGVVRRAAARRATGTPPAPRSGVARIRHELQPARHCRIVPRRRVAPRADRGCGRSGGRLSFGSPRAVFLSSGLGARCHRSARPRSPSR